MYAFNIFLAKLFVFRNVVLTNYRIRDVTRALDALAPFVSNVAFTSDLLEEAGINLALGLDLILSWSTDYMMETWMLLAECTLKKPLGWDVELAFCVLEFILSEKTKAKRFIIGRSIVLFSSFSHSNITHSFNSYFLNWKQRR